MWLKCIYKVNKQKICRLIYPINKHWSKLAKENGNKTFTIYRATHWVSEDITEKEFIDNCISVR